ncbi:MAG: hypothetical protein EXS05_05595 [Planctomycetaceae bacterium]|nr:hypothetical protein [Planctomycetaceae bacterium]
MLTSAELTCADGARLTLAVVALVALATAAARGDETIRATTHPTGNRGGHARWQEPLATAADSSTGAARLNATKPAEPAPPVFRLAANKILGNPPANRTTKKTRQAIRPAGFEEPSSQVESDTLGTDAAARSADGSDSTDSGPTYPTNSFDLPAPKSPVVAQNRAYDRQSSAGDDVAARRERLRTQITRPFKQIRQINPYFDYEPDPEVLERDRCYNLCPRPGSPDCPDCDVLGPDGPVAGRLSCPECPLEIDLRDTARVVSSINDFPTRNFPHFDYCWEPTNMSAYPLYFEDFALERYGHTRHYLLQPPLSVGLFAAQFLGLPYQMAIDPPWCKRYALGYYRPGQYVPPRYYQVPWNTRAAVFELGMAAGGAFLFAPSLTP